MKGWLVILALGVWIDAFSQARYDTVPNVPEHYRERLEKFRKEPPTSGRIMFLGNSITEGGNWRRLLKDSTVINRGISGDNSFGVINRLDEITRHRPSKLFLLIGVNDLSKTIPNAVIIENIFSIVSKIHAASPATKIFVESILPVNPNVKGFPARFGHAEDIREINGQLAKYSDALKFTFVDLHTHFLSKDLLDAKFTYDGLHLNAAGYAHWIDYLKKNKTL